MKLYRIWQNTNAGYDVFDAAIVAAPNEKIAKNLSPKDGKLLLETDGNVNGTWVTDKTLVKVEYLGKAKAGTEQGLILSSFIGS